MTEPAYDLIIRGGRVATATDIFEADVAITGESIAAIGRGLGPARREIDANWNPLHHFDVVAGRVLGREQAESLTRRGSQTIYISFESAAERIDVRDPQIRDARRELARAREAKQKEEGK